MLGMNGVSVFVHKFRQSFRRVTVGRHYRSAGWICESFVYLREYVESSSLIVVWYDYIRDILGYKPILDIFIFFLLDFGCYFWSGVVCEFFVVVSV